LRRFCPLAGVEEGTFVRRSALWDASACQRQVWKKSKTKNFVFRFALLSLIRTFVGEFVKTINK
jgi:hypothetical protein